MSAFAFIAAERANHSVARMCRLLGVSRQGFYAWATRGPSARAVADAQLTERIVAEYADSRGTYGAPRMRRALARAGIAVSVKRVARLMGAQGLVGVSRGRRRRGLTHADARAAVAPDRVGRRFVADGPNRVWVSDITYIPTAQGWLYLAIVMDVWSRRIVGWSMREDLRAELVVDALQMATTRRRPPAGCIAHSDRGSQYTSTLYGAAIEAAGLASSMGARGCAYDNAACESAFSTLKVELDHINAGRPHPTRRAARLAVFDYIEAFYNRLRMHSALGYRSPAEYEADHPEHLTRIGQMPDRAQPCGLTPRPRPAHIPTISTAGSPTG